MSRDLIGRINDALGAHAIPPRNIYDLPIAAWALGDGSDDDTGDLHGEDVDWRESEEVR